LEGCHEAGLRRTEFHFRGPSSIHLDKVSPAKIEFCTCEPDLETNPMTRLNTLHRHLVSLRRSRTVGRWATAYSAVLSAALWLLLAVFAVDVAFQMDVLQRVLVMALAAAGVAWSFRRYAVPELGVREDLIELALLVEKKHQISSDLVAAIQFEQPEAAAWGSRQLEQKVIESVSDLSRRLDVFEGLAQPKPRRRAATLLATTALVAAIAFLLPEYTKAFLQRLCLASVHYPSATVIEQVAINHRTVLDHRRHGSRPADAKFAEGYPLDFWVRCAGVLPAGGRADLTSAGDRKRPVDLQRITLDARRARLQQAAVGLREGLVAKDVDLAGVWARDLATLARVDAPDLADAIESAGGDGEKLGQIAGQLEQRLAAWPGEAAGTAVYAGQLPRLVSPLQYQLYVGDGWTDPAAVAMIPLPVVESQLTAVPPSYARTASDKPPDPAARQISVLEGSEVQLAIECTNGKPLSSAWLTILGQESPQRYDLTSPDEARLRWSLSADHSPLARVLEPVRFEVQVTDQDGLHLETPIRGYVRIKQDRPPVCGATVVHKVVLPTAKPKIEYRVNDDYGIAKILLHVAVERERPGSGEATEGEANMENQALPLLATGQPVLPGSLPVDERYVFDLAALQIERDGQLQPANLAKGDRLKLTLEAVDYRGDLPGESYQSDPLILEISDEAGVLAAISEADEKSEQRLTDIIKQQLGIGEGK